MTKAEKNLILSLRQQKYSFSAIAEQTGMSVGTIKSFLSRAGGPRKKAINPEPAQITDPAKCKNCGLPLPQADHRKQKSFCSDRCRLLWWNTHRDLSKRSSASFLVCPVCGRSFYTYYGQYCSRACAGKARTQKAGVAHG